MPLPLGFDQARMNAIHLYAVLLAAVGQAFSEGCDRRIDRAADSKLFVRFSPAGAAHRNQGSVPLLQQGPGGAREPHMREKLQRKAVLPIVVGQGKEVAAL